MNRYCSALTCLLVIAATLMSGCGKEDPIVKYHSDVESALHDSTYAMDYTSGQTSSLTSLANDKITMQRFSNILQTLHGAHPDKASALSENPH